MKRRFVASLAASALLTGCYVVSQAVHQNDLFNTRRPVQDVAEDPKTPVKLRRNLEAVDQVLHFAEANGLNSKGAYHYIIVSDKPVVSYLVEAAYPDRLEFVTHWFPVIGAVPYLGYFREEDRDEQAAAMTRAGYDVYTAGAGAFSSLGWFDDPIFSSMLERSDADTAHLFLHELTHRTLWVAGSTEFNENLAEYVAGVLTPIYLESVGKSEQVGRYVARHRDRSRFKGWLTALKKDLTTLYATAKEHNWPRDEILAKKQALFARYQQPPLKPAFEAADYVKSEAWNNASILGAGLYAPDVERFARAHHCVADGTISGFLKALGKAAANREPFAALDSLCDRPVQAVSRVD